MKLTPEQLKEIENYAGIGYAPEKIGIIIGIQRSEIDLFVAECNDPDSDAHHHYVRGELITDANIKKNLADAAKTSITAGQIYEKNRFFENIRQHKNSLENNDAPEKVNKAVLKKQYRDSMDYYHALQNYIAGNADMDKLPEELKQYWQRLNTAYDLFMNFHNRAKGKKYVVKLICMKYSDISESSAYRYIHEAQNFFGMNLTKDNWRNILSAALDKVISVAWQMDRLDLVIKAVRELAFINKLHEQDPESIPDELLQQKVFLITGDADAFGFPSVSRKDLLDRIRKYDLTESEKLKIAKDAQISDADFEMLSNDSAE